MEVANRRTIDVYMPTMGQNRGATLLRLEDGLDTPVTSGLVEDGLASALQETVRAGGSTLEVVRVQITEQSRMALVRQCRAPDSAVLR